MGAHAVARALLQLAALRAAAGLAIVDHVAMDHEALLTPERFSNVSAGTSENVESSMLLQQQKDPMLSDKWAHGIDDHLKMLGATLGTPAILALLRSDVLKKPSLLAILVVSILYIAASLFMNVLNKKAAKAFEGTCLLVIIQMLVSVVVIFCMEYDKMKLDKWMDFLKWLVVPFAFAGMLGTSMFAFKEASLTSILIMRNILPILTFGCEKALFNQPESTCWKVVSSLVVTLLGSVLYGFVDVSATSFGKILILVNCLFTIVDRLVQAHLLKGNKDFGISIAMCMLLNNTLGIVPILLLAMVTGETAHWGHSVTSADRNTWLLVVMSGLCGASLGYVGLRTQQLVSGTTVLVLQNFNKLLILSIGMVVFHEQLTLYSFAGCGVSLMGCFAYGYLRLPSEAKSKDDVTKAMLQPQPFPQQTKQQNGP